MSDNVFNPLLSLPAVTVHGVADFNQKTVDHVHRSVDKQHIFNVWFRLDKEGILIARGFRKCEQFSVALTQQSVVHLFIAGKVQLLRLSSDHDDFSNRWISAFGSRTILCFFLLKVKLYFSFVVEEPLGGIVLDLNRSVSSNPVVNVHTCAHQSKL